MTVITLKFFNALELTALYLGRLALTVINKTVTYLTLVLTHFFTVSFNIAKFVGKKRFSYFENAICIAIFGVTAFSVSGELSSRMIEGLAIALLLKLFFYKKPLLARFVLFLIVAYLISKVLP